MKKGEFNLKGRKKIFGVGINDADYIVRVAFYPMKKAWVCPFYQVWVNMLRRCYSLDCKKKQPTYKDCVVCEEWLTFSKFKEWMENQDWQGNQIDKDILVEGNKIYSPDMCVFISKQLNLFTTDRGNFKGQYMIGVSFHKGIGRLVAKCNNPITKKREHLGCFENELDAHLAWKERKLELVHEMNNAGLISNKILYEPLVSKYSKEFYK